MVCGNIGAMLTLKKTVEIFKMVGHSRPVLKVYSCFYFSIQIHFYTGCPNSNTVHNASKEVSDSIFKDNCDDKYNSDWLVPRESNNTDAELIINVGCMKIIKGIKLKNLKKELGGTREFTVFLSDLLNGPWAIVLSGELPEQENFGCAPMQSFDLE